MQSSTDTPTSCFNVNQDRSEQNRAELELTKNVEDKNIEDQKNERSKISITTYCNHWQTTNVTSLVVLHRNTSTIIFTQR